MCLPGLDKIAAISIIFLRNRSDLIKFWEEVNANASYLYGFALKNFNLQHEWFNFYLGCNSRGSIITVKGCHRSGEA